MSERNKVMLSVVELIEEIVGHGEVFDDYYYGAQCFPRKNEEILNLILTQTFIMEQDNDFRQKLSGRTLSDLMNAKGGKSSVVGERRVLAQRIGGKGLANFTKVQSALESFSLIFDTKRLSQAFALEKLAGTYDLLVRKPIRPTTWIAYNSKQEKRYELEKEDRQLDIVRKFILYLYGTAQYPEFFWWLFLLAMLQREIVYLVPHIPKTQYPQMLDYLETKNGNLHEIRWKSFVQVEEPAFWDVRRRLIETARGHLIIAGPSLKDAFDRGHKHKIWRQLTNAVEKGQLTKVSILVTDPIIFNNDYVCSDPKEDVKRTISSLEENFYALFNEKHVDLCIYFLPLLQIDHAVITEEFMVFRSNKLWNYERKFKGAFTLHTADYYTARESEYRAHVDYLNVIMDNSTVIYPEVDVDETEWDRLDARSYHKTWREYLRKKNYSHIYFYKVYEKQIHSYVCNTWSTVNGFSGMVSTAGIVKNVDSFYNPEILLCDDTQKILLPYIKETEEMFTEAIKKHDRSEHSFCRLYPSLDLGFPNNVRRLAGGFATGMLVTWNCGVDMVPIDATVNVCTSSVFKLDRIDMQWLNDPQSFYDLVDEYAKEAGEKKGYSFSFLSGNHFLTIAKDKDREDYYLVLHSSANELKHSYMGLYPVEDNWYSKSIKHINGNNGRYFRYLKDEDARYFIRMAKNFQKYNEQIHQWVAERINGGIFQNDEKWMAHHYYMPTDQSIAIGTFAEPVGTQVPMFSAYGKSVYIFEIGSDNFQIDLGGQKGKVCLIPHGWGQKIDGIESISVRDGELVLQVDGKEYPTRISSQEHIRCDQKKIRQFENGEEFLEVGDRYISGKFVKELIPCVEYSRNTVGKKG